jgi:DNA-binding NtrC family response regulator
VALNSFVRSTSSPASRTVLVVEDARDVRELFTIVLQDAGYRVESAESVEEALGVLRKGRGVDVVVADYKLADGTGAELIHQASNEGHLDVRVTATLICTAYRYVELPPHVSMLRKPVDGTQLLLAVERALGLEHVA